jgi:hypothetical protein
MLAFNQIWLNLSLDHHHFSYNTKLPKKHKLIRWPHIKVTCYESPIHNGTCQLEDVKCMVSNDCLIDTYSNIFNDKTWQQAHFEKTCSCF